MWAMVVALLIRVEALAAYWTREADVAQDYKTLKVTLFDQLDLSEKVYSYRLQSEICDLNTRLRVIAQKLKDMYTSWITPTPGRLQRWLNW